MKTEFFSQLALPAERVEDLRRQNPWWEGRPMPVLPPHRRHLVGQIHRRLKWKLAPVVVVRGPRQIGKTTAQLHVVEDMLAAGVEGRRIARVQFDDLRELGKFESPILRVADWFERAVLGCTFQRSRKSGNPGPGAAGRSAKSGPLGAPIEVLGGCLLPASGGDGQLGAPD